MENNKYRSFLSSFTNALNESMNYGNRNAVQQTRPLYMSEADENLGIGGEGDWDKVSDLQLQNRMRTYKRSNIFTGDAPDSEQHPEFIAAKKEYERRQGAKNAPAAPQKAQGPQQIPTTPDEPNRTTMPSPQSTPRETTISKTAPGSTPIPPEQIRKPDVGSTKPPAPPKAPGPQAMTPSQMAPSVVDDMNKANSTPAATRLRDKKYSTMTREEGEAGTQVVNIAGTDIRIPGGMKVQAPGPNARGTQTSIQSDRGIPQERQKEIISQGTETPAAKELRQKGQIFPGQPGYDASKHVTPFSLGTLTKTPGERFTSPGPETETTSPATSPKAQRAKQFIDNWMQGASNKSTPTNPGGLASQIARDVADQNASAASRKLSQTTASSRRPAPKPTYNEFGISQGDMRQLRQVGQQIKRESGY